MNLFVAIAIHSVQSAQITLKIVVLLVLMDIILMVGHVKSLMLHVLHARV